MPGDRVKEALLAEPVYYVMNPQSQFIMRGAEAVAVARRAPCMLTHLHHTEREAMTGPEVSGAMVGIGSPELYEILRRQHYPVINLSNSGIQKGMGNLLSDDAAVGRLAAAFLRDRGYRSFLAISFSGPLAHEERAEGFCEAVRDAGFPVTRASVSMKWGGALTGTPTRYRAFLREQVRKPLSDAPLGCGIFATNNQIALIIQQVMRSFYPEHLDTTGVLGCDNPIEGSGYFGHLPTLSSVIPAFEDMGAAGMEWLLDHPGSEGKAIVSEVYKRFPPKGVIVKASTASGACADPLTARMIRWTWEHMHLGDKVRVSDIAAAHRLNRKTLERRFSDHAGTTPGELIARLRLDMARELLRTTRLSVAEISETCGYAKQDVLSRALRRELGCTPTEYRRQAARAANAA